MNTKLSAAIGGFAGACALTLINQLIARFDSKAPRLDLLGMNTVAKFVKGKNLAPQFAQKLLPMSVAGDLTSNTLYYALASGKDKDQTLIRGALLGLAAGIGAVALPKPMGLDETPTNQTTRTQAMTVIYYVVGGLVAAAVINSMDKDELPATPKKIRQKSLVL